MGAETWAMLAAERRSLLAYLETLGEADWGKPSLCEGWTVKDVVAHLAIGAASTPPRFIGGLVSAGFSFDKMTGNAVRAESATSGPELRARFASRVDAHTQPGGAMVGEAIVHGEDIRRALGQPPGPHAPAHLVFVADAYRRSGPPVRGKTRVAGLRLESTDVPWSSGDGPLVSGPLLSLILAMTGRRAALADLTGEGVATFGGRMAAA